MGPRAGFAVAFGGVAFLAADFFTTAVRIPMLWYLPLERSFTLQTYGAGAAMDFYGRLLWCALAAALVSAVAWFLSGARAETLLREWEHRFVVWMAVLFVLAGALHVTQLVQRTPVPLELPR